MATINSYKDLIVWQKAMDLVDAIYTLSNKYPREELFGLTAHTRKTSISIPSNITEGRRRTSRKELHRHLVIAYASGAELETQIEIARRREWSKILDFGRVDGLLEEVMKMLNKMTSQLYQ